MEISLKAPTSRETREFPVSGILPFPLFHFDHLGEESLFELGGREAEKRVFPPGLQVAPSSL